MALKKFLTIGVVAAVLVACGGDGGSNPVNNSGEDSSSSVCEDCNGLSSSSKDVILSGDSRDIRDCTTCCTSGGILCGEVSSDSKFSSSSAKPSSSSVQSSSSVASSSSRNGVIGSSNSAKSSSSVESSSSVLEGYVDPSTVVKGTMTDERDGQSYKTVTIGRQTWMAENLNYAFSGVPYNKDGVTSDSTSWCYANYPANCTEYGRLYTWAAAMDSVGAWSTNGKGCGFGSTCSPTGTVRGICPDGWHLPTKTEFDSLLTAVGGESKFGMSYKGVGLDDYSFAVLFAGGFRDGKFYDVGHNTYFWSSTEDDGNMAYHMFLRYNSDEVNLSRFNKNIGMSVRCVMDE